MNRSFCHDGHAGFDLGRAGAHATSVGEANPAILTRRHQAEAGTIRAAEFETTQRRPMQEDGREQEITLARFGVLAVYRERNGSAFARDKAAEQAGIGHRNFLAHSMCS
jgi:hypothetical protein